MKVRIPRSRKKLAGLGGAVALILAIGAYLLWSTFFAPPTEEDYKRALAQANALKSSTAQTEQVAVKYVQAIVSSLRVASDEDKLADDTMSERADYEAALQRYDRLLGGLRASPVSRDDDSNAALQPVLKQADVFTNGFSTLTDVYPLFYASYISCNDVERFTTTNDAAKDAASFKAASDDCAADLATLAGKSRVKSLAEYADARRKIINAQQAAYAERAKPTSDQTAANARLSELESSARMLDPLAIVQKERAKTTDMSALTSLIKTLESKRS